MKKRRIELVLVVVIVAVIGFLMRPVPEPALSDDVSRLPRLKSPKPTLSEDAKWILTTAADSYAPRLPVESAWENTPESAQRRPSK